MTKDLFDMVFKEDKENDNSCVLSRITMDLTLQDCYNGVKKITEFDYGYNCPLCSSGKHEMHYTKCSEKGIIKILIADDDKKSEMNYMRKRELYLVAFATVNVKSKDASHLHKIQCNNLYLIKHIKISLLNTFGGGNATVNHFGQTLSIKYDFAVIQNNEYYRVDDK
ncbi:hypothetical protein RFI_38215 [Reticulomyxa filosa]|uniref:Uncharacterized protein n=1 Tax=Reticulomyxa filosa TaxID=46433 RepID=X6LDQ9_RETFI|nr:hypothetical protein RFI_38215 [Reticulomyxa filosa]|eukprot:ETN99266.1 hypothetical protein RFI_38215 [Reticulomyxa filosa]